MNAFTDASLENLQDICTVHFELFPTLGLDEVTDLFTETKQRYLWSRDLEAG